MGHDCTLHVVDEADFAEIRARLLAKSPPDADAARVREVVATSRVAGAHAITEYAIGYLSTRTPHVAARGVALSLWELDDVPWRVAWSVGATHLAPIVKKFALDHRDVPAQFDQNHCTGVFVPAEHVPAILAHVERALDRHPAERGVWMPLLAVLRVAAARELAYWEATDLAVAQTHPEWLTADSPPPPAGIETAPGVSVSIHGCAAVAGNRQLVFDLGQRVLQEVSFETWPPTVTTHPGHAPHATFAPWGALLADVAVDRDPWTWRLREEPPGALDGTQLPVLGALVTVGDSVLVVGHPRTGAVFAIRADGTTAKLSLPRVTGKRTEWSYFAAAFPDGASALIVWDGKPYRWDGHGSEVVALPGKLRAPDGANAIVGLPDGSLAGAFGRGLRAITRDGTQRVLAPLTNVLAIALGPDEAIVCVEGENREGDALKVVWLGTRELAHVAHAVLGIREGNVGMVHFDHPRRRLVIANDGMWRAIPWSIVATLPRTGIA